MPRVPPPPRILSTRLSLLLLTVILAGCQPDTPQPPRVFAAASLGDVLTAQQASLEASGGEPFMLNLAGSNQLAQQILAGARADLFLSANTRWVDELETANRLEPGTRRALARNQLVLIAHPERDISLTAITDLAGDSFRYLALGHPEAVPAGIYARRYLESIPYQTGTMWEALAPRVAPAADVRRALAMVANDPSILGFVYRTDVHENSHVRVLLEVPREATAITYEIALLRNPSPAARQLYEHLLSQDSQPAFRRFGFAPAN
ncbi:MAG: molybdate ABC transporter substrate-binding protein [Pseudomonadota bacterium]